jgi:predicted  nucleic acid-binding Zn-ribbon protein
VKLGAEIEKMRQKTAELEEFFERKGKEWDSAMAAEDAAWERILEALKSQASHEDADDGVTDFMAKVDEEEKRALEVMDQVTQVSEAYTMQDFKLTSVQKFKEETERVTGELGNSMFYDAE